MNILQSDWFSRDKPFHAWLHSMVVRAMRSYTVFPLEKVILISVMAGIVYSVTKDPGVSMMVSIVIPVGAAWLGVGLSWLTIVIAVAIITAVLFSIHFILGKFA